MPRDNNSIFLFGRLSRKNILSPKAGVKDNVEEILSNPILREKREKKSWSKIRVISTILSVHEEYIEAINKGEKVKFNFAFFSSKSKNKDAVILTKKMELIFRSAFLDDDEKIGNIKILSLRNLIDYALPEGPKKEEILKDFKISRKNK